MTESILPVEHCRAFVDILIPLAVKCFEGPRPPTPTFKVEARSQWSTGKILSVQTPPLKGQNQRPTLNWGSGGEHPKPTLKKSLPGFHWQNTFRHQLRSRCKHDLTSRRRMGRPTGWPVGRPADRLAGQPINRPFALPTD